MNKMMIVMIGFTFSYFHHSYSFVYCVNDMESSFFSLFLVMVELFLHFKFIWLIIYTFFIIILAT